MTGRKYEKKLHIDMPFDEALTRFGTTDPKEIKELIKKKGKRTAGSEPPAAEKSSANRKRQS